MRPCLFAVLPALLLTSAAARAEVWPSYSLRELSYKSDTVLLTVPDGPLDKGRFQVTQVLKGRLLKSGERFTLAEVDRAAYSLAELAKRAEEARPGEQAVPVSEALLFLSAGGESEKKPPRLLPSGLLLGRRDGGVLAPRQVANPGPYHLTPSAGREWAAVVRQTKGAVAAVDEVTRLRALPPRERTPALLAWVERHRFEFGGGFFDDDRTGWGSLETDVFRWLQQGGTPEDCWAAARLYAELNHGYLMPLDGPKFGTPAGRAFLLRIALNENALEGDRACALALLAQPGSLHSDKHLSNPDAVRATNEELVGLMKQLTPLLDAKSVVLRRAAVSAVREIASAQGAAEFLRDEIAAALPVLDKTYKAEPPGPARDLLAETVHKLGGADHWRQLTGNPQGVAALLRDYAREKGQHVFWLQLLPASMKIHECPTLVLETQDAKGKLTPVKTLPLPAVNPPKWADGWGGDQLLFVRFAPEGLKPGTYRLTVTGTAGPDKAKWTSEPKTFTVAAPPNGTRGRPPYGEDRSIKELIEIERKRAIAR